MSCEIENELLRVNNQLCYFSGNGKFLAIAFQTNLVLKNIDTLDTFQSFMFPDVIEYIEWSPDNEYILCSNIKKAIIQVYSISYPQWKYKLTEGSAGLESVSWSPDSKHILTLTDFNIQTSVWSLEDRTVTHIQNLKSSGFKKLHFTTNGKYLAVVVTDEGQDNVEIYKTSNWKVSRKLICERLSSIDGICWSPNDELLCIWCSCSGEPKLIVYSAALEKHIAVYCPRKNVNSSDVTYMKEIRGIENIEWVPSGQLLAISGFNEVIVLLNHITWKPLFQLYLDPVIRESNYLNKVYKECVVQTKGSNKQSSTYNKHILEEAFDRPINIRIGAKNDNDKLSIANAEIFEFSFCGQYLAIKHQLYPTTLWIWDITTDYIDYILLEHNITAIKWNPLRSHLLIFSECAHLFEWTPNGARCIPSPRGITVLNGRWHPDGKVLLLCGYNKAIVYNIENESV